VVATLARQDGRRVFPRNDFYRAGEASRIVEARYGLTTTAASDRTAAKRPTDAEQEKTARRGHAEPVRTTLRWQVRTAAAGATTIADFLERLRRDGVLVRERHSERDPDEITGYSVASPDSVDAEGKPVYYGGGRLAADLTLPKLRTGPRPPAALRGKTYSRRETERAVGKAPYSVELDAQRISAWLPEDLGKAHSTANWAHRLWRRRLRNPRTSGWVASTVPVNAIAPIATSTETLPSFAQYTSRRSSSRANSSTMSARPAP
jgi:hypothetical protein